MANICTSGKQQSPITIKPSVAVPCSVNCDLLFYYRSSTCNIINSDSHIVLEYDPGSYVLYNGQVYELDKISFCCPAAHIIYPAIKPRALEVHLLHRSPDTSEILIIAVFVDANNASSKSTSFFELFSDSIPQKNTKNNQAHINTPDSWNVFNILPEEKSFFTYKGSLPREPCTERVTWVVMDRSVNCKKSFLNNLKQKSKPYKKPLQKLGTRTLNYNANTGAKNRRNYGNRLRCYNEKEFRQSCKRLIGKQDMISSNFKFVMKLMSSASIWVIIILLVLLIIQQQMLSSGSSKVGDFINSNIFLKKPGAIK